MARARASAWPLKTVRLSAGRVPGFGQREKRNACRRRSRYRYGICHSAARHANRAGNRRRGGKGDRSASDHCGLARHRRTVSRIDSSPPMPQKPTSESLSPGPCVPPENIPVRDPGGSSSEALPYFSAKQ
jgi:hypothetical protein